MAAEQGMGGRIKDNAEDLKEGLEETYEQRPGEGPGEKIGGIFKQAVQDAKEARNLDEDEQGDQ